MEPSQQRRFCTTLLSSISGDAIVLRCLGSLVIGEETAFSERVKNLLLRNFPVIWQQPVIRARGPVSGAWLPDVGGSALRCAHRWSRHRPVGWLPCDRRCVPTCAPWR